MTIKNFYFFCKWLDKLTQVHETEAKVEAIKQDTQRQIDKTAVLVKRSGELQQQILSKTTTYYIGRAIGGIK